MKKIYILFSLFILSLSILGQPWVSRHGLNASEYQAEFTKWTSQGYRLVQVSGYNQDGKAMYAAIFEKIVNSPPWQARHGLTTGQYQVEFDKMNQQGYRPVQVSGYAVGNTAYYAAIFEKKVSGIAWKARHGLTASQFQTEFDKSVSEGYRLVDLCAYNVGSQDYYAGIFEKSSGPAWIAKTGLSSSGYQNEFLKLRNEGFRLKQVYGYQKNGNPYFAAIWEKSGTGRWYARHGLKGNREYQDEFDRFYFQGFRPVWISGYNVDGDSFYTGIWESLNGFSGADMDEVDQLVSQFMKDYSVPGLSFALAKDGKLVLAKTYGFADTDNKEQVAPRHRFRIASVSKPITSIAIMKLVEQNKLKLSDKVFGIGAILGTEYGKTPYSSNVDKITVQHLLEHTSGGWGNKSNDPMFSNSSLNQKELISWTLNNRLLENIPGQVSDYSNFGYCVLGRIIEKKSGQKYDSFVKNQILSPLSIQTMDIAGDTKDDRKSNEVIYYGQEGENPYGMKVARMDSHGGWIARPIDLVRLLVRVDKFPSKPDILSNSILDIMYTTSSANAGYAKGWAVNKVPNYWHNGSLPGNQSYLVRTNSGFCWAILVNTRSKKDNFDGSLDKLMWNIISKIDIWPNFDF